MRAWWQQICTSIFLLVVSMPHGFYAAVLSLLAHFLIFIFSTLLPNFILDLSSFPTDRPKIKKAFDKNEEEKWGGLSFL